MHAEALRTVSVSAAFRRATCAHTHVCPFRIARSTASAGLCNGLVFTAAVCSWLSVPLLLLLVHLLVLR
eukprot:17733-Eustigmatos_ZCMA.PRE.1